MGPENPISVQRPAAAVARCCLFAAATGQSPDSAAAESDLPLQRVLADQAPSDVGQPRPRALGVGREVRRPQGQTSPTPVTPLSVSMISTVLSKASKHWVDQLYEASLSGRSTWWMAMRVILMALRTWGRGVRDRRG